MFRDTRPIGWVKAARKAFDSFPPEARERIGYALTIAAEGGKADIAKPMKGLGAGVMEIARPIRAMPTAPSMSRKSPGVSGSCTPFRRSP